MQDFSAKTKALFDCLDGASEDLKGTSLEQRNYNVNELLHKFDEHNQHRSQQQARRQVSPIRAAVPPRAPARLSQLNGKKSIFKKPELPIARCLRPKRAPDYVKNPHRWMKYTLTDVSDVTETSNTVAAFEVLKQLEERRECEEAVAVAQQQQQQSDEREPQKIEFKKASKIKRHMRQLAAQDEQDPAIDAPKLKGTKFVMPEYVVGQCNKNKKLPRRPPAGQAAQQNSEPKRSEAKMQLTHLMELDEDSDSD